jgi:hypothetical protein
MYLTGIYYSPEEDQPLLCRWQVITRTAEQRNSTTVRAAGAAQRGGPGGPGGMQPLASPLVLINYTH